MICSYKQLFLMFLKEKKMESGKNFLRSLENIKQAINLEDKTKKVKTLLNSSVKIMIKIWYSAKAYITLLDRVMITLNAPYCGHRRFR